MEQAQPIWPKLRLGMGILCLFLAAGCYAGLLRSESILDVIGYQRSQTSPFPRLQFWEIGSTDGTLQFISADSPILQDSGRWDGIIFEIGLPSPGRPKRELREVHRILPGLAWLESNYLNPCDNVVISYWYFIAASLLMSAYCFARCVWRSRPVPLPGYCVRCGYDLRATSGVCPECGTAM